MEGAAVTDEILDSLNKSYEEIRPLLEYLKARLKYDTVRWIRTYGTKDDIVFSTRVKNFERTYDKLIRKGIPLSIQSDILDIALLKQGVLDDLIGIRFIRFDAYQIYNLISYFLITERVSTSERGFYASPKTNLSHPIYRFLQSNGFNANQKPDREYEDINFIIRFAHPIDRYFSSGLETFESLAQQAQPSDASDKLATLNVLFDQIKNKKPHLIRAIPQFPIECQIVTATQHIYNRTQRPHYEYILQAKDGLTMLAGDEVRDLSERLELLKLNLLAIDQNVFSIHKKFGIQYEAPSRINPGEFFQLEGRLPKDILGENHRIENINAKLLPTIISYDANTMKRKKALAQIFKEIERIDRKIRERGSSHGDIVVRGLLQVDDLAELSHQEIVFWAFQRIILFTLGVALLYAHDRAILEGIISSLKFTAQLGEATKGIFSDVDIVLGRLFEKLEHIDHAIQSKLSAAERRIKGWKEGYFSKSIFSDPLVQWRYASLMYRKSEYRNALQEMSVGLAIYDRLDQWIQGGERAFPVPERTMFARRQVEYELCADVQELKYTPVSVAGILELCNSIQSRHDDWHRRLEKISSETRDLTERARCLCFQILFSLCAVSAGGLRGQGLEIVRREYRLSFELLESTIVSHNLYAIQDRSWWLLAKSVMDEALSQRCLRQFASRIREIVHHPLERKQFEEACARLIELWIPAGATVASRSDFAANVLVLLKEQTDRVAQSEALSQMAIKHAEDLSHLLSEVTHELKEKGKIETQKTILDRVSGFVGDVVEQIAVDTAVAGLRSVIGF